jgi:dihydroxyacetone kinase-like protein
MGKAQLSVDEAAAMFIRVSDAMVASKDKLTQADKAAGDGDHGVSMARGFTAVREQLDVAAFPTLDALLRSVGTTLMTSVGGASGAVFGTFFRGAAPQLVDRRLFDSIALSLMLTGGLNAVKARGGAQPGDKTLIDALEPAAQTAERLAGAPLSESLLAVSEAARRGMENTKEMVARVGKAKTLGERSLGHPDPGAVSTFLILDAMRAYVTEEEDSA